MTCDSAIPHLTSSSEGQTEALGHALGLALRPGSVVGLVGELGAGKTCLARGVARGLEVPPEVHVSSPTFTLVNEYAGRIPLYHVDLYRLGDPDELVEIGLEEYYGGQGACLVEWFDRFPDDVPAERLVVQMAVTGDDDRELMLEASGEAHRELASRWCRLAKAE